jgi:hypothetical protein
MKPTDHSRTRTAAAALLLAFALSGCSSAIDYIPTALGGLPEGVPERPTTPHKFPNVHEMPRPREDTALSDAERTRLRTDLTGVRQRTGQIPPTPNAPETTGATAGGAARP